MKSICRIFIAMSATLTFSLAQKPPAAAPMQLQVAVQGYEMAVKDAAALLTALPGRIDSKAFLLQVASLVGQGKAKIVKWPMLQTTSGERASVVKDAYKIEIEPVLGADRKTVSINIALSEGQRQITTAALSQLGGAAFLGTVEGSAAGLVNLVFIRITNS